MNDKTIVISDAINSGENFLAHYGIKGQQWGQRRFQNEDGTLTEEGRRRYGLNPQYSGMTDKDLRDALEKKRTQNEYTQMVTAGARKKQQDIRGFTAEALNVAGQGVNLWDKTKLESDRKEAQTNIDKFTEAKREYIEKMNDMKDDLGKKAAKKDPTYLDYKSEAEKYENMIKEQKGLKDEGIKAKKDLANIAVNTGKSYAPDLISKGATAREIKEKTAEAQRNIEEMDHEQLKKVVDRMKLEKQYDELMNPPKPSKVERGREVLQTIGALMGVALTALSIAEVVKKLGKKGDASHTDLVEAGEEFLAHYRTKGSKNGVRRYQNEDGSLTPEGYRHYGIDPNGRQAADPREILARQRAQEKADSRQAKAERRQAGYTQKFAERQALRDAKNNARIQNVYNRQALQAQRMQTRQDLEDQRSQEAFRQEQNRFDAKMKAENRANIRKNIIKGVAAVAVIGAALYTGRHFLQQRALDNQHVRDIDKIKLNHKNDIERIRTEAEPIMYENETKRMIARNEHNEKMQGTYEQHTKRYEDVTERKGSYKERHGAYVDREGSYKDRNGTYTDRKGTYKERHGTYVDRHGTHDSRTKEENRHSEEQERLRLQAQNSTPNNAQGRGQRQDQTSTRNNSTPNNAQGRGQRQDQTSTRNNSTPNNAQAEREAQARAQAEREAQAQARAQAEREAQARVQAEREAQAEMDARIQAEREAQARTQLEDQRAQEEARIRAEREAQVEREAQARVQAEREAQAEMDARIQAEREAQARTQLEDQRAQEEARIRAEREAQVEREARAQAEMDARIEAERDAQIRTQLEEQEAQEGHDRILVRRKAAAERARKFISKIYGTRW